MERLDFSNNTAYNAIEACIHLNRYAFVKPFCEGACILDAACGQGYGSYLMKTWGAKEVTGIDIDAESVAKASQLFQEEGLQYSVHTVEALPFADASFDVVVSFETIEHIDSPELFLQEIKRVLKPGGTVILSCPNDNYYYENDITKNPFHKREYTYFQFKEMAEQYLGNEAEYYFSFALDGFVNMPLDKCTEPGKAERENALGILHHESCTNALCVPQENYLNMWNANYYIGVWGAKEACYRISTVIAPRAMFIEHKDQDFDFLHHVDQLQRRLDGQVLTSAQLSELLKATQEERNHLKQHTDELDHAYAQLSNRFEATEKERNHLKQLVDGHDMAAARLKELLELARKEKEQLQQSACDYAQLKKERDQLQQHLDGQIMACARLTELLELTRKERDQLQHYANSQTELLNVTQGERDWLRNRWESLLMIRIKRLLVKVLRKAKQIAKKLLGRGN